ncbi:MAG: cytidylate kinase-like family protein [Bacteroidales bacterium]|nr:cytidylate kinase-like family protein [Bacteroidales bacterium]
MENLLYEYMSKRFAHSQEVNGLPKDLGPVITLSRQAGCGASKLAHDLCTQLNEIAVKSGKAPVWHFINHEILEKSAEKLNLDPGKLNQVITDKERGIMDQIIEALSSHTHKSDQKIMKTMYEVIRQIAEQGNVIIVGRGGATVSQHIPHSLHIKLEAPIQWRCSEVMKKLEYSREYSMEYIRKMDEQRQMYVQRMIQGSEHSFGYDVILNPSRFNHQQMVQMIISMAGLKGIH